ncbi:hypothetical protein FB45DRAFT_939883 [Roridomyces roridus]|uniref:Uncharacterized protein n=1 Tax=Roridomyces roridus TaxID=1738132 RepID=A0AAD7B701_9AGAR|nr:hypothetical protein FB45DRAFT_939883 [Roridomyces roridus]
MLPRLLATALSVAVVSAHLGPVHPSMYCYDGCASGTQGINYNNDDFVKPLYQMSKSDWWFHAYNNVPKYPPQAGQFLELPAGKSFTVEIASNRGETSYSFSGKFSSEWPDGGNYPEDYNVPSCITSPNMHTQNQSMAAGTAFAIAYTSDINQVTEDNLSVFTVRYHTPWKRETSYDVPADMPACPDGGCICAWGWIPNGCGQPNMYHLPYRCTVTGATSTKAIGTPQPPVWCQDDSSKCVKGPKQMLYWHQNDGDNIEVDGLDNAGQPKSPAYNMNCGFADGAQDDIFTGAGSSAPAAKVKTSSSSTSSSKSTSATPAAAKADSGSGSSSSSSPAVQKVAVAASSSSSSASPSSSSAPAPSSSSAPTCKNKRQRRKRAAEVAAGVAQHRRHAKHGF